MPFKSFCAALFLTFPLMADPWGKDADLPQKNRSCIQTCPQRGPGVSLSSLLIRFHQEVISPADGPRSHFIPSSSQYTLEAVRRYGFFKGWMLGCDRLMRENDEEWIYRKTVNPQGQLMKSDPVP